MTGSEDRRENRSWPAYLLGGRLRTTTAALLIAFGATLMAVRDLRAAPAAGSDSGQRGGATRFHPGPGLHLGAPHRRAATRPGCADDHADDHTDDDADHADHADDADHADHADDPDQSHSHDGTQRPGRAVPSPSPSPGSAEPTSAAPPTAAGNIRGERGAPRDTDSGFSKCLDSGGSSAVAGWPADYTGVP